MNYLLVKSVQRQYAEMARLIVMTVLLLANNFEISRAVSFDCTFQMRAYTNVGNLYECFVEKLLLDGQNVDNLTAVYGSHQSGKGNSNVEAVYIFAKNMAYFPRNIEAFFPNIRALYLRDNSLSNVSNYHLAPFPNLEFLSLRGNKITSLDSNFFYGLALMKWIDFTDSDIKHVGHDFILPNSGTIYFNANPCIGKEAFSAAEIIALRFSLLVNCPPTISQIERTLESRNNLLTDVNGQVQSVVVRTNNLEESHTEMDHEINSLTNEINSLANEINSLTNEVTGLKYINLQLETRLAFLEAVIETKLGVKID